MNWYVKFTNKFVKFILLIATITTKQSVCLLHGKKATNYPVTINARINWGENSIFNSNILLDANESDTLGSVKKRITDLTGIPFLSQRIYLVTNGSIDYNLGPISSDMTLSGLRTKQSQVSTTNLKPHLELQLDIGAPYLPANKLINTTNLDSLAHNDVEQLNKLYEQLAELLASQYKISQLLERSMDIKRNWASYKHFTLDKLCEKLCFQDFKTHHSNLNDFVSKKDMILNNIKPGCENEVEVEEEVEPLQLNLFQDYPRESHHIFTKIAESITFNLPITYTTLVKFTVISQLMRITGNYPPKVNALLKFSPLLLLFSKTRHGSFVTKILLRLIPFKYVPRGNVCII